LADSVFSNAPRRETKMTFDGFDLGLLIESSRSGPTAPEAACDNTLDYALAQLGQNALRSAGLSSEAADRAATKADARLIDLWHSSASSSAITWAKMHFQFEPLMIDELNDAKRDPQSSNYEGQHVIVTGHQYIYDPGIGSYNTGASQWTYSSEQPVPPPEPPAPTPEDLNCMDTSQMTPEQLLDYRVSEEAAKIAREILAQPDHDTREYASFIYMDSDGQIRHTPIRGGTATMSSPSDAGINYGQIYGLVHSHPAVTYIPSLPDFKLYPTPGSAGPNGQGDWEAYDYIAMGIYNSAMSDNGATAFEALTQMAQFRQYILGATGGVGTNSYQLRGYDTSNRDMVTLGQKISLNLGLCN
jgi:hypothetical protein